MDLNDERLAGLISDGNEDAFEELVRTYGGLIKAIVHYHLRDISMWQEDCINDVLLKIWQNIDRFDAKKSTLKNWIGAVAKYRAIDYKRRYCRELMQGNIDYDIADRKAAAELMKSETEEEINSLLSNLSPEDKEIFKKRYILDIPIEEIAASHNKSTGYIYNRLSRGRKKLRSLFAGKGCDRL